MKKQENAMRFGDFLVARGVATTAQIQEALDRQEKMRPSRGIAALRLGIVSLPVARKLAAYIAQHSCSFDTAALALGAVSAPDLTRISKERAKYDPKLGVVLMTMGVFGPDELYMLLQHFEQQRLVVPPLAG